LEEDAEWSGGDEDCDCPIAGSGQDATHSRSTMLSLYQLLIDLFYDFPKDRENQLSIYLLQKSRPLRGRL
jgi:hypothetical protein